MEFIELIGFSAITASIVMVIAFFISIIKRDAGVVDVAWGIGFVMVSAVAMFLNVSFVERSWIVMGLVFFWGGRLAIHILSRNRGKKEDWRYAQWRNEWGSSFIRRSFFHIFLIQAVLIVIVSVPIVFIHYLPEHGLGIGDSIGIALWCIGFVFEVVGDHQLRQFTSQPQNKGKVMTEGLWRYTRHPNYFGEVTMWWGIFIIALSLPNGIFTVVGPVTITYLILFVSGIPLLEKKYASNKAFQQYRQVTSIFFPWFPKKTMQDKVI